MNLNVLVKFVFGILLPSFALSNDLVSLKLKATGCEHSCDEYADNKTCPSSILINGVEKSRKKDGFNILVIDNDSGSTRTAHFRWSSTLIDMKNVAERKKFVKFFDSITSSSVIVIVFQKMCNYIHEGWYQFLTDRSRSMKIINLKKSKYIAIVVACKYSCPRVTTGSIPYSYSGPYSEQERTVSITFKLRTAAKYPYGNGVSKNGGDGSISYVTIIAPLAAVALAVIILLTCCYCHDTYKRTIQQNSHALHYGRDGDEVTESRNGSNSCSSTIDHNNEPYYEELGALTKPEQKSENVYVDCNEIKHYKDTNSHTPLYDEPARTLQPSAPPLYLYAPLSDKGS